MRRTIIIGDVQGCLAELDALLDRVGLTSDDALYFVGDLVARGPSSLGVLRRVREVSARSVIGNHEERLLAAREARRRAEALPKLEPSHAELLETLQDEDWSVRHTAIEALTGLDRPEARLAMQQILKR